MGPFCVSCCTKLAHAHFHGGAWELINFVRSTLIKHQTSIVSQKLHGHGILDFDLNSYEGMALWMFNQLQFSVYPQVNSEPISTKMKSSKRSRLHFMAQFFSNLTIPLKRQPPCTLPQQRDTCEKDYKLRTFPGFLHMYSSTIIISFRHYYT